MSIYQYEVNPLAIEQESFRQIRELTPLDGMDEDQQQVAMRLVHTCGDPSVVNSLRWTGDAVRAGCAALAQAAPVLCDVEMVKQGLTKRYLQNEPICYLNDPVAMQRAKQSGETRSMAAVDDWIPHLGGSVVLIGNAPTALFRLLERLHEGAPKPALIIGMPVGFVGAAESKQALWEASETLGLQVITLLGRVGGSALAAAAHNALLRVNRDVRF